MAEYSFKIKEKKEVAEHTLALWLDTSNSGLSFTAGQFVDLEIEKLKYKDGKGNMRPFSIASSPNHKDYILIASRIRDTGFKKTLEELKVGSKIKVMGPMGNFVLHKDHSKPVIILTGGIGITPFRSIIEYATEEKLPHKIYLFYSNKTKNSTAFLDDLEKWGGENKNLRIIPTITEEQENKGWGYEYGRIGMDMIKKYVPESGIKEGVFYIAGPPGMVGELSKMLTKNVISGDNIKTEDFIGY